MSTLLSRSKTTVSQLCRCQSYDQLPLFYSSTSTPKQLQKGRSGSSNGKDSAPSTRRLARDLTPSSGKGELKTVTQARKDAFKRDAAPHTEITYDESPVAPSRPRPTWKSDRDRSSRTGRWGDDSNVEEKSRYARTVPGRWTDDTKTKKKPRFGLAASDRWTDNAKADKKPRFGLATADRWTDDAKVEEKLHYGRPMRSEAREANTDMDYYQSEFYEPPSLVSSSTSAVQQGKSTKDLALPKRFTSPPLLPGLLASVEAFLPPGSKPTPIQALSIKWVLETVENELLKIGGDEAKWEWRQWLLASETGSGKSIAYLMPLLQSLKRTEQLLSESSPLPSETKGDREKEELALNPRALILAPTHELARQLTVFAKHLLHNIKLRVLCTSKENTKARTGSEMVINPDQATKMSSRNMRHIFASDEAVDGVLEEKKDYKEHPVDVVVGTPMKLLELARGVGWNKVEVGPRDMDSLAEERKSRRGRDLIQVLGAVRRGRPEMGLEKVEWVVVDEADILFDPDFKESTLNLLSDIAEARGSPLPVELSPSRTLRTPTSSTTPQPINYPFNLLLTSATIPNALISHLNTYHPSLMRLTSPNVHKLPKTLTTEYVDWTGGNKFVDVERRIREVWLDDSMAQRAEGVPKDQIKLSKVLIFVNKSNKVLELGEYLEEKGVQCVKMTNAKGGERMRGSNKPFKRFLRPVATSTAATPGLISQAGADPSKEPYVLITTSLLSRGLDFSPDIKHVLIIDEPRNMIDFLHRAGRSGRAGNVGKVVIFGKGKGRGSERVRSVRKKVRESFT